MWTDWIPVEAYGLSEDVHKQEQSRWFAELTHLKSKHSFKESDYILVTKQQQT